MDENKILEMNVTVSVLIFLQCCKVPILLQIFTQTYVVHAL